MTLFEYLFSVHQAQTKGTSKEEIEIDTEVIKTLLEGPDSLNNRPYHHDFLIKEKWSTQQRECPNLKFVFVPWHEGKICYASIPAGFDILSCGFSGCAMAVYKFEGRRYGCHITLMGPNRPGDCRDEWNMFAGNRQFSDAVLFKPDTKLVGAHFSNGSNRHPSLWGLISGKGRCYNIVVECDTSSTAWYLRHMEECITPKRFPDVAIK